MTAPLNNAMNARMADLEEKYLDDEGVVVVRLRLMVLPVRQFVRHLVIHPPAFTIDLSLKTSSIWIVLLGSG